jgi:hypothetical protein
MILRLLKAVKVILGIACLWKILSFILTPG